MSAANKIIQLVKHPVRFRMFLFWKLPSAFFSGVRVRYIDEEQCKVTVPFKWLTQNPFRSTYFASLSMAAEMSTGVLAMMHVHGRKISMLVVKVESEYFKKAVGRTTFICTDGLLIRQAIEEAVRTGEPSSVRAASAGLNDNEETVALFHITWSFKAKT